MGIQVPLNVSLYAKKALSKLDKRKTIHTLTQKIFLFLPLLGKYFCWFLTLELDHPYGGYCRNADSCVDNPVGTWLCSMVLHYARRLKLYRCTAANQIWTPHGQPLAQEEPPTSSFAPHISPLLLLHVRKHSSIPCLELSRHPPNSAALAHLPMVAQPAT